MERILKYPIAITDEFVIEMPKKHKILVADVINHQAYIWALVDPDSEKVHVNFVIYGTGHAIDKPGEYVGTVQSMGGVWHIFKRL